MRLLSFDQGQLRKSAGGLGQPEQESQEPEAML